LGVGHQKEAALREAQEARSQKERLASQLTDRDRQVQELWTGHQEVVGQLEGAEKKVAEVTESASTRIAELEQRVREAQTARQRICDHDRGDQAEAVGVVVEPMASSIAAVTFV